MPAHIILLCSTVFDSCTQIYTKDLGSPRAESLLNVKKTVFIKKMEDKDHPKMPSNP